MAFTVREEKKRAVLYIRTSCSTAGTQNKATDPISKSNIEQLRLTFQICIPGTPGENIKSHYAF